VLKSINKGNNMNKWINRTPDEINHSIDNLLSEWNISDEHNKKVYTKISGLQLRKIRIVKGWTQTRVSKKLKVSFQQIQKYERGQNSICSINEKILAEIFDVEKDYFIKPILDRYLRFTPNKRGENGYTTHTENVAR
tara:strand:- start:249 stop:659 length:411 start_codon:yes stop_codon:yes gene_type:complete